ncbi:hypothetical protein TYRP_022278 [Tyrophagus putrescentiae]|nr:hypothetical protein TYRP_022278 [Tyrophagus putrescentiae]
MPKYRFSFLSGLMAVSLLFYNYVLFTRPHTEMNDLLKTILIDDSKSQKFINENRYFLYKVYCGRNVLQFIRRFCLKVLNTFASLILVSDFLIIYTEIILVYKLATVHYSQLITLSFWELLLILLYHLLNFFSYCYFFLNISHVFGLYYTTGSTLLMILFIRLQQSFKYLLQLKRKKFQHQIRSSTAFQLRFDVFRAFYIDCLHLSQAMNDACASLFFAFFCSGLPLNSAMVNWLLLNSTDSTTADMMGPISKLFITFFILYQLNVMMIIHLIITCVGWHIRRPVRLLKSMAAFDKGDGSYLEKKKNGKKFCKLKAKLTLSHQIFAIDSQKGPGFTYGRHLGMITMGAFFLLLYSKAIMTVYKLKLMAN